jgi:membrane-associated phospholipid phosphatase
VNGLSGRVFASLLGAAAAASLALAACGGDSKQTVSIKPPQRAGAVDRHGVHLARAFSTLVGPVGGPGQFPYGRTLDEVRGPAPSGPLLAPDASSLTMGRNRISFSVLGRESRRVRINGSPVALYTSAMDGTDVDGPYIARSEWLSLRRRFMSRITARDLAAPYSTYVANVPFERPGKRILSGVILLDERFIGLSKVVVDAGARGGPPRVGDRAIRIHTPTVADVGGDLSKIDTRSPPAASLHRLDFADVLGKKPVVLMFASPRLCRDRACAPDVDAVRQVQSRFGRRAAFIHMELYRDNRRSHGLRPEARAWHVTDGPWAFVIDRNGRVAARFQGAFSAAELRRAVKEVADQGAGRWIRIALDEIASHSSDPPRASRALALVSVAMYRAERAARAAEAGAAVAGAASTSLAYLFPDRSARFRGVAQGLADAVGGRDDRRGLELGTRIGRGVVESARSDGSNAVWLGMIPMGAAYWMPTPPVFVPTPLEPTAGRWRPWNLRSGSEFRPAPPPAVGSPRFEAEMRQVYRIAQTRTAHQRRIARRWADGPGTYTPPGHWNRIALRLISSRHLGPLAATRVLALLNTAEADAFIACWDTKYTYWKLRPVTAIRREIDPIWVPYVPTPPFPSYVSGHSTVSGAASVVLAHFFPDAASGVRRLAREAMMSRLYAGIHYESDDEMGLELGTKVGKAALARFETSEWGR